MEGIELAHDVVGSHDTLRYGLPALKSDILPVHPVEVLQRTSIALQVQTKRALLECAYGSAFPMKMDIERQILSRVHRPPGLVPSSMLGLESLTGELDEFGFEDFLNDPKDSDTFLPVDMHEGMEVRLGLSKGPVSRSFFQSLLDYLENGDYVEPAFILHVEPSCNDVPASMPCALSEVDHLFSLLIRFFLYYLSITFTDPTHLLHDRG